MKRYARFRGRASRSEYWFWYLCVVVVSFVMQSLTGICMATDEKLALVCTVLYLLAMLVLMLPGISVFVRRMHDTGRSGWSWLWGLIPLAGCIILLVFLVQPSEPPNRYGVGPDGPEL